MTNVQGLGPFKTELERACKIAQWSPTEVQLRAIRADLLLILNSSKVLTEFDVTRIIARYVDSVLYFALNGVDNSEIHAAILLALRYTTSK